MPLFNFQLRFLEKKKKKVLMRKELYVGKFNFLKISTHKNKISSLPPPLFTSKSILTLNIIFYQIKY